MILKLIVVVLLFIFNNVNSHGYSKQEEITLFKEGERNMSEHIIQIMQHYKQEDPVGIPGVPIPEPLDIPPLKHSFAMATMHMREVKLYGLSKFRIEFIDADLASMQVKAGLRIEKLDVNGSYVLSSFFGGSRGPFTVILTNVFVTGAANLEVENDGKLRAQEMNMDITFDSIAMNFENLGLAGSMFQGIMNSLGTFIFDSIKPFILKEVNHNIRGDVNNKLAEFPKTFPNSISPFDQMVAEGRRIVREKYDPYMIPDNNQTFGYFTFKLSHTWLMGLSSFYRFGDVDFRIQNNTLFAKMEIGTQKITGVSHWEVTLGQEMVMKAGSVNFTVNYINVGVEMSQTLDTRNHPILRDIQLEMGNIQVRCDGAGTLDYFVEFGVNVLPNLLRYQIMDALETPLKNCVQENLNYINVEEIVTENKINQRFSLCSF